MNKTHEQEVIDEVIIGYGTSHVIVHNDDWHSFDQVIYQLKRAISCTAQQAQEFAIEIHNKGKARVYSGSMEECLYVSAVLEEIDLMTSVEA